jgi:uncharacterized protein (DUF2141 family)
MKRIGLLLLSGILLVSAASVFTSCKKKEDPTKVKGNASFPAGTAGDLSNAKVSLYLTYEDWVNNSPVLYTTANGSGANVSYEFSDINAGNYYLDVWKDNDFDGTWSVGDFVGWYGSGGLGSPSLTPMQVSAGNTFTANVTMYVLIAGLKMKKM